MSQIKTDVVLGHQLRELVLPGRTQKQSDLRLRQGLLLDRQKSFGYFLRLGSHMGQLTGGTLRRAVSDDQNARHRWWNCGRSRGALLRKSENREMIDPVGCALAQGLKGQVFVIASGYAQSTRAYGMSLHNFQELASRPGRRLPCKQG